MKELLLMAVANACRAFADSIDEQPELYALGLLRKGVNESEETVGVPTETKPVTQITPDVVVDVPEITQKQSAPPELPKTEPKVDKPAEVPQTAPQGGLRKIVTDMITKMCDSGDAGYDKAKKALAKFEATSLLKVKDEDLEALKKELEA